MSPRAFDTAARRRWPPARPTRPSWPACPAPADVDVAARPVRRRRGDARSALSVAFGGVIASRLAGFGTTIFTEMSALAERTGAINLGQGFPDEDGPAAVLEAAQAAMRTGHNQYAPLPGRARAARRRSPSTSSASTGSSSTRDQVQVTMGATEAITAAMLGLCEPGDEVLAFDPTYDSYARGRRRWPARGSCRCRCTRRTGRFDPDELAAAVTPKHARDARQLAAQPDRPRAHPRRAASRSPPSCIEHDLIAITDEVYEHLVFDGLEHIPLATLPGMAERTLTISSLGKTFSVTGWKVGWATGPASLVAGVRAAKQFLTFAGATPFQYAGAAALRLDDDWYARVRARAAGQARPPVRRAARRPA